MGCRCGKGAQGGVGILALVPHPPGDGARIAPLAWLAPASFQAAPKLAWAPEPWVRAGGVSQKLENLNTSPS